VLGADHSTSPRRHAPCLCSLAWRLSDLGSHQSVAGEIRFDTSGISGSSIYRQLLLSEQRHLLIRAIHGSILG
jgi:hypothetical protein